MRVPCMHLPIGHVTTLICWNLLSNQIRVGHTWSVDFGKRFSCLSPGFGFVGAIHVQRDRKREKRRKSALRPTDKWNLDAAASRGRRGLKERWRSKKLFFASVDFASSDVDETWPYYPGHVLNHRTRHLFYPGHTCKFNLTRTTSTLLTVLDGTLHPFPPFRAFSVAIYSQLSISPLIGYAFDT